MIIDSPIISGSQNASGPLTQIGDVQITGSLGVTGTINGSITGSITSASYAATASSVLPLIQNVQITGSLNASSITGSLLGTATSASYLGPISQSLIPAGYNYNLGSPDFNWNDLYVDGYVLFNTNINIVPGAGIGWSPNTYFDTNQVDASNIRAIVSGQEVFTLTSASVIAYKPITGSLLGTASYAENANTTSASFASYSASVSTRLTTDETNITTLTNASASFAADSASLSTRLTQDETNYTNLSSSFASTSGSAASRLNVIETSYATTGSNNFTGTQYISNTSNPQTFTTTASLYTDGGLRVSKDSFISGTAYFNNVVIYGTSSIQYITSSQINVGANIINLNTQLPAQRFGGMAVADSGSNGATGSLLWDSVNNGWIYTRESGSTYRGGALISGPRNTGSIGNEQGTTACYLMMGQGGDHITSSAIYTDTNATCFYGGNAYISGSGAACFASQVCAPTFAGNIGCFTTSICSTYGFFTGFSIGGTPISAGTSATAVRFTNSGGDLYIGQESNTAGNYYPGSKAYDNVAYTSCAFNFIFGGVSKFYITPTGIGCFASTVCTPKVIVTGDSTFCSAGSTTIGLEGTTPILNLTRNNNATSPAAQINFKTSQGTVRWQIATNSSTGTGLEINQGDGTNKVFYIDTSGRLSLSCYLFVNGGGIGMDLNSTITTISNYGYGGALQLLRSDATSTRWARIGMVDSGLSFLGGMTINNNLSATFDSSLGICNGGAINMTIPNGLNGGSIRMVCCTGANEGDMYLTGGGGVGVFIAGSGRVSIGTTSPCTALDIRGSQEGLYVARIAGADYGSHVRLQKARGSVSSPTIVSNGDTAGSLTFEAYNGSGYSEATGIRGVVNGAVSAGVTPTDLFFAAGPNGTTAQNERMRITSGGLILACGRTSSTLASMGNIQEWVGAIGAVSNNTGYSLFSIANQYDNLSMDIYVFTDVGSYQASKHDVIMSYTTFVNNAIGYASAFCIFRTGTQYYETMTICNLSGTTVNNQKIAIRVWGYGANQNGTGGTNLLNTSCLTRIK